MRLIRPILYLLVGATLGAGAFLLVPDRGATEPTAQVADAASDTSTAAPPSVPNEDDGASSDAAPLRPPAGAPDSAEAEVRPARSAELAFPVAGVLAERMVDPGAAVEAGDALARLDDDLERARLREAEAAVRAADAQVRVARAAEAVARDRLAVARAAVGAAEAARDAADADLRLTATQAAAQVARAEAQLRQADAALAQALAGVDEAETGVEQAAAQVAQVEAQRDQVDAARASAALAVERRTLRAPFGGVVLALGPEAGETVTAGAPAATLADVAAWRVDTTNLTELQVVGVRPGNRVTVEIDALPGRPFDGVVERVGNVPALVRGDVTYVATIRIDADDPAAVASLRPGMTAIVRGLLP